MKERQVANILLNMNFMTFSSKDPFSFSSGILSPIYTDCRLFISHPNERKKIIELMVDEIIQKIGLKEIDVIAGTASVGIPIASWISRRLNLPMIFIRTETKAHGKENQIEGVLKEGNKILLIEDLISTGKTTVQTVKTLREKGGIVNHCVGILDFNFKQTKDLFEQENIKQITLTNLKVLLDIAKENNLISSRQKEVIESWTKNPWEWEKTYKQDLLESGKNIKTEVAEILLKIKAVTLNPNKPYRYASGIFSPIYTDNRLLISYPIEREKIITAMVNVIENQIGLENIDIIAGTATAGIPHSAWIAERLDYPMIYINKEPDQYGKKTQIEGLLKTNSRVLLIEDLVSTGRSSIEAVKSIKKHGGIIKDCLTIFTYEMEKSKESFAKENINLIPLTDFTTMIEIAVKNQYIKEQDKENVLEWAKNPSLWGKKMGFEPESEITNFADRLIQAINKKQNPSVVGLDSDINKIPNFLKEEFKNKFSDPCEAAAECVLEFNKRIIDSINDIIPAVKLQAAFYEQCGHHGFRVLKKTSDYAKSKGLIVIEDAKRNDIGNTARAYADAHIGKVNFFDKLLPVIDVDCITVNPYFGIDGIKPFIDNIKKFDKGIFVLVKTSNPSSGELQDLMSNDKKIYEIIAELVDQWGTDTEGNSGYKSVGAVVGATCPEEAQILRKIMPKSFFLVPGYGAQGGGAQDIIPCFNSDGYGAIIHSSRSVIFSSKEKDFDKAARDAAIKMKQEITTAMKEHNIYPW